MDLGMKRYQVTAIDGDYAHLQEVDHPEADDKLVARALLPGEIQEGSYVVYEMLSYRMDA